MGFVNLGLGSAEKTLIAGRALWFYLWKLFWPVNLAFSYPRWNIDAHSVWQYGWPVGFVTAIVCAWLLRNRIGRGPVTALLFFPAMLFPMLGFFPLYTFVYTFVADHYQYMASIGPVALVAAGGAVVFSRSGKNARFVIASAAGVLQAAHGGRAGNKTLAARIGFGFVHRRFPPRARQHDGRRQSVRSRPNHHRFLYGSGQCPLL